MNARGRVYAFHGIAGTATSTTSTATAADNFVEGPVDNGFYGTTLGLVGSRSAAVPGSPSAPARPRRLGNGVVDLHFGSTIAGPFVRTPCDSPTLWPWRPTICSAG